MPPETVVVHGASVGVVAHADDVAHDVESDTRRSWLARTRLVLLWAYGAAYLAWFFKFGAIIDHVAMFISVAAFVVIGHLGMPWRVWRRVPLDLTLYAAMFLAYDETRGAADRFGFPLQVESVRNIDRVLFFGTDPSVWLQRNFYSPDHIGVHDVIAGIEYFTHFFVPIVTIAVLWITSRRLWVRFMRRFATILAIACVTFVVLPTAPPWMAAGGSRQYPLDALPPLARPLGRGWRHLGLEGFILHWETGRDWANPIAAMPSLHSAWAMCVVAFFWPMVRRRSLRWLMALHPILMGISLVYLAEHYVTDVLAGWLTVWLSFALWRRIERRMQRSSPGGAGEDAVVDHQRGAGDTAGGGRGEEDNRIGDLIGADQTR
jgi:membrane-associated phospholipid phosphatase